MSLVTQHQFLMREVKRQLADPNSPINKWWAEEWVKPRCPCCGQITPWKENTTDTRIKHNQTVS